VMYASAARTVLAAPGLSAATKGLACAGLLRARSGTRREKSWAFRRMFDAILADEGGMPRYDQNRYPVELQGSWLPDPGAAQEPSCSALFGEVAGFSPSLSTSRPSSSSAEEDQGDKGLGGFLGPFEMMGISGYNDLGRHTVAEPAQCAAHCRRDSRCRSFDFGARGRVAGECWLSTANRDSARSAYTRWPLYDYYERGGGEEVSSRDGPALLAASEDEAMEDEAMGLVVFISIAAGLVVALLLGVIVVLVRRGRQPQPGNAVVVSNDGSSQVVLGRPVAQAPAGPAAKEHVNGVVVPELVQGA